MKPEPKDADGSDEARREAEEDVQLEDEQENRSSQKTQAEAEPAERTSRSHESELASALRLRSRVVPERTLPRPRPLARGLESIVTPIGEASAQSTPADKADEPDEAEPVEEPSKLEERVTRSVRPEDLRRMRGLADRVYYEGWGHLSRDEQQAFLYHSRFLKYLSEDERNRSDIRSTMYHFVGAQGKSLGLETTYTTRELSLLTDRFFGAISTPFNRPDLYRAPLDTGGYKSAERRD